MLYNREPYRQTSRGLFWSGITFFALGILVLLSPLAGFPASCSAILLATLASGIAYIVQGFYGKNWFGFFWSLFAGMLALITSGILISALESCPCCSLLGAIAVFAVYTFVQIINRAAIAISMRQYQGWKWLLFSGIASIILGAISMRLITAGTDEFFTLLPGIDLLIVGLSFVMFSRNISKQGKISHHQ